MTKRYDLRDKFFKWTLSVCCACYAECIKFKTMLERRGKLWIFLSK